MNNYIKPSAGEKKFTCPYCNTLSSMKWNWQKIHQVQEQFGLYTNLNLDGNIICVSTCASCGKYHLWHDNKMIIPAESGIEMPNDDMPENVKDIYMEARSVFPYSLRAAVALLRLALQLLCKELGEKGKNINDDIGALVKRGLPVQIQQALDVVRVTGNSAVHPGEIDLEEKDELAGKLFGLLNLITEQMITQPKKIAEMYESLPPGARVAIENRDSK